jgi:hypothetical protein
MMSKREFMTAGLLESPFTGKIKCYYDFFPCISSIFGMSPNTRRLLQRRLLNRNTSVSEEIGISKYEGYRIHSTERIIDVLSRLMSYKGS